LGANKCAGSLGRGRWRGLHQRAGLRIMVT